MQDGKILILTHTKDIHADYIVSVLKKKSVDFFRFNADQYPNLIYCDISISDDSLVNMVIKKEGQSINSAETKSVLYFPSAFVRPDRYNLSFTSDVVKEFYVQESDMMMQIIFKALHQRFWVNSPDQITISNNKLYQLELAKSLGFSIPKTLYTNSPEEALKFIQENEPSETVLKTRSGILHKANGKKISAGVPVRIISKTDLTSHKVPMFLQRYIEKKYELRITVVGDKVFPCEIHSQKSQNPSTRVDWRVYDFENVEYAIHNLPSDIEKKCISITKNLGLNYSAIDMILTPNDEYVFLEVNSHGLWQWVEVLTGLPISSAIAELLIEGACDSSKQKYAQI